ncbi:MAG: preprotein translocase subunit SecE [Candidatus Latescibacteria bacterium]|jgi:preprotein translocase subunit SecE|nr:preprotein translocase subunit SecE [Candidatus Latescibacterota bacterium]
MAKLIEKIKKFFREVKSEMSKVTWPSWNELKGSTILVIIVSAFFAIYIGFIDIILTQASNLY